MQLFDGYIYAGFQLLLPALFIHFFALFPEPRAAGGRRSAGVTAAYGVAGVLFAGTLAALVLRALGHPALGPALAQATVDLVRDNGFFEYFEASTGVGLGGESFTWSAALCLDLVARGVAK